VKEKDIINGVEVDRIDDELFSSFDPEDELWMVGGSKTHTMGLTNTSSEPDYYADYDWTF
jgi:hypothetical protein